jgi:hypothetical protein
VKQNKVSCRLVSTDRRFEGAVFLHLQSLTVGLLDHVDFAAETTSLNARLASSLLAHGSDHLLTVVSIMVLFAELLNGTCLVREIRHFVARKSN